MGGGNGGHSLLQLMTAVEVMSESESGQKRVLMKPIAVFIFIFICGVFCGWVSGVKWGMPEAAYLSVTTLLWGFAGALITALVCENL